MSRKILSFDGKGINGPDEYRERIATFTPPHVFADGRDYAKQYGPLFEASPYLLEAGRAVIAAWESGDLLAAAVRQLDAAIAHAEGRAQP